MQKGRVGGTWLYNTYPGAGCDVQSHLYSFSFEPNPNWSRCWALQPEILAYIQSVCKKYDLFPRIRLKTEVLWAKFLDAKEGVWLVCVRGPDGKETTMHFDVVVTAVGQLNRPRFPDIPGREEFKGPSFHSAQWDHGVSLEGKTIITIGTGASAAQFIPCIAPSAKKLYVCQRSPNYLIPKGDYEYSAFQKWVLAKVPFVRRCLRGYYFLFPEFAVWPAMKFAWFNKLLTWIITGRMSHLDPSLVPTYPLGCKRLLLDPGFGDALKLPNVEVVTEKIARITPTGIVLHPSGREISADVIIYGTGFDATSFTLPKIQGPSQTLQEFWAGRPQGYLGITVPGFPNFFMTYGPNTNLGHNSIIFMLECQINYIMQGIRELTTQSLRWMDVKPAAYHRYARAVKADLARTVWASPTCTSWYKGADGDVITNAPFSCLTYMRKTWEVRFLDYTFAEPRPITKPPPPTDKRSTKTTTTTTASTKPTTTTATKKQQEEEEDEEDDEDYEEVMSSPSSSSSWETLLSDSPAPPSDRPFKDVKDIKDLPAFN